MPEVSAPRSCLAIVLAAGEGTRMKSSLPKVLHAIAGRSMVEHVLAAVGEAGAGRIAVVVGPDREDVAAAVRKAAPGAEIFVQRERLGTAHAVLAAREALAREAVDDVIVAFADTPLVDAAAFASLRAPLADGAAVAALGFEAADPHGYGRLVMQGERLVAIREEKDASEEERRIRLCNAGLMAFSGARALSLIESVGNENAKGEYYLTDVVGLAAAGGLATAVVRAPEELVQGVNDRVQLAAAERAMQKRLRERAMREGATLIDPDTVYFSFDTRLARDVIVEPNVFFAPGVTVDEGATIRAFSHLEAARVGPRAEVGPFARLRPGADLGRKSKVGNFVEVKKSTLGEGAKVNHLTYIGDAEIGAGANVGAGTITCNYDGFGKHRTLIGEGAFVGSNSSLVAPVSIGAGAYVGSGSVVTKDVPADALALARGRQIVIHDWAVGFRQKNAKK